MRRLQIVPVALVAIFQQIVNSEAVTDEIKYDLHMWMHIEMIDGQYSLHHRYLVCQPGKLTRESMSIFINVNYKCTNSYSV